MIRLHYRKMVLSEQLSTVFEFDAAYNHIFQYLLGRTLVVETMERAIALQKKYNQQLRIVTLTGEQFQPGGSLTGGSTKKKRSSLLSVVKKRHV